MPSARKRQLSKRITNYRRLKTRVRSLPKQTLKRPVQTSLLNVSDIFFVISYLKSCANLLTQLCFFCSFTGRNSILERLPELVEVNEFTKVELFVRYGKQSKFASLNCIMYRAGHLRNFFVKKAVFNTKNHKCPALKIAFFWTRTIK